MIVCCCNDKCVLILVIVTCNWYCTVNQYNWTWTPANCAFPKAYFRYGRTLFVFVVLNALAVRISHLVK